MLKLGLLFEKNQNILIDMTTGEIYARGNEIINDFLKLNENNYTLQII